MNGSRFVPAGRLGRKQSEATEAGGGVKAARLRMEPLETRVLLDASLPAGWQATPIADPHFFSGSDLWVPRPPRG